MRHWYPRSRLVLALALLLWCGRLESSWGQTSEPIGSVLAVEGAAEVRAATTTTWETLQFRAAILPNDTIRTAAGSKVKVLLRDESIVTVAERSEMQFTEFLLTPQRRRTVVSVATGTLRMVAGKLLGTGSATEVRTPNTVAGVRGTTFVVTFIAPAETEVVALEGAIDVRNPRLPQTGQLVPADFQTRVVGNNPPEPSVALPLEKRRRLEGVLRLTAQIPVEVTPTLARARVPSGPVRGEAEGRSSLALLAPPAPLPTVGGPLAASGPASPLEALATRTTQTANAHASAPSHTGTVITSDNRRNAETARLTQQTNLRVTITLPR